MPRAGRNKTILLIVEGQRREPQLLERELEVFGLADHREIVPLEMDIHALLDFIDNQYEGAYEDIDLREVVADYLGDRADDASELGAILCREYTDVLLVFTLTRRTTVLMWVGSDVFRASSATALTLASCISTIPWLRRIAILMTCLTRAILMPWCPSVPFSMALATRSSLRAGGMRSRTLRGLSSLTLRETLRCRLQRLNT